MRTNAIVVAASSWMSHLKLAQVHMYSPILDVEMSREKRAQKCRARRTGNVEKMDFGWGRSTEKRGDSHSSWR